MVHFLDIGLILKQFRLSDLSVRGTHWQYLSNTDVRIEYCGISFRSYF